MEVDTILMNVERLVVAWMSMYGNLTNNHPECYNKWTPNLHLLNDLVQSNGKYHHQNWTVLRIKSKMNKLE